MEKNKQVIAVVYSEQEAIAKIRELKLEGYDEHNIHIMAKDESRFNHIEQESEVSVEKATSFKDSFKGIFKGGANALDGIKSFGLSDSETERYSENVSQGGILIYVENERKRPLDVLEEGGFRDREGNRIEPSTNEFVNSVDNEYVEQEDRFERGESFQEDPKLVKDQDHLTFSSTEKPNVKITRSGNAENY
ncbi:heat induced stress protein YflT [Planomicrobium soli]|uniref:Heat induced stress protein YflT n=1 Tax=Planomicrobium soli TaxID=1176648 RepID=A0A2P8GCD4_9BACL|nr:general stress protein [Planomicrobium soli]PSL31630.1 heat induced stress protein YflT [Planomicrobium soli]